jgi:hypothetical protein
VLTLTFDEASLTEQHFGNHSAYRVGVVGLPVEMHLRRVISQNQTTLDVERAGRELVKFIAKMQRPHHKHLVLECTNLPPYKAALKLETGLDVTDILSCIESVRPGSVREQFSS